MRAVSPGAWTAARESEDWASPFALFVLLKAGQEAPELLGEFMEGFLASTTPLLSREKVVDLSRRSGYLFLNKRRLPVDFTVFHATRFLVELFRSRRIGGIRFLAGLEREEVEKVVPLLLSSDWSGAPGLEKSLDAQGVEHVRPLPKGSQGRDPLAPLPHGHPRRLKETHFRSLFITKRIIGGIRDYNGVDPKLAKRILHGIVDLILEDPPSLEALTRMREAGGDLFDHSLNVAIVAVVIGQKLGLPRRLLGILGTSALLHDFGLVFGLEEAPESAFRNFSLLELEAELLEAHTVDGFLELLKGRELADLALRTAIVAREHHHSVEDEVADLGAGKVLRPTLLSRIVSVADAYDMLCAYGPEGEPLGPKEALAYLRGRFGERFDQDLVAILDSALQSLEESSRESRDESVPGGEGRVSFLP